MASPQKHVVDCPDCDFAEIVRNGKWAADAVARSHAGAADHTIPEVVSA
jgi:hypothetical protein